MAQNSAQYSSFGPRDVSGPFIDVLAQPQQLEPRQGPPVNAGLLGSIGYIYDQFAKGARDAKIRSFVEKENQKHIEFQRAQADFNRAMADPDLTPAARKQIEKSWMDYIHADARPQIEKAAKRDGKAALFKNVIDMFTGGRMPETTQYGSASDLANSIYSTVSDEKNKISYHRRRVFDQVQTLRKDLEKQLGHPPTPQELAAHEGFLGLIPDMQEYGVNPESLFVGMRDARQQMLDQAYGSVRGGGPAGVQVTPTAPPPVEQPPAPVLRVGNVMPSPEYFDPGYGVEAAPAYTEVASRQVATAPPPVAAAKPVVQEMAGYTETASPTAATGKSDAAAGFFMGEDVPVAHIGQANDPRFIHPSYAFMAKSLGTPAEGLLRKDFGIGQPTLGYLQHRTDPEKHVSVLIDPLYQLPLDPNTRQPINYDSSVYNQVKGQAPAPTRKPRPVEETTTDVYTLNGKPWRMSVKEANERAARGENIAKYIPPRISVGRAGTNTALNNEATNYAVAILQQLQKADPKTGVLDPQATLANINEKLGPWYFGTSKDRYGKGVDQPTVPRHIQGKVYERLMQGISAANRASGKMDPFGFMKMLNEQDNQAETVRASAENTATAQAAAALAQQPREAQVSSFESDPLN